MKIKGMQGYLCDFCGEINNDRDVSVTERDWEFCSYECANKGKAKPAEHRCWVCALKLDEPVVFYWWSIVANKYLPVFCSLECRQRYEKETQKGKTQAWISVKDRLPSPKAHTEQRMHFLIGYDALFDTTRIAEAFYFWHTRQWFLVDKTGFAGEEITDRVLYWQPLPETPVVEMKRKREVGCCEDCRHWRRINPIALMDRGECLGMVSILNSVPGGYEYIRPITREDFGCIEFESKSEGQ